MMMERRKQLGKLRGLVWALKLAPLIGTQACELHQGQRDITPHKKAGHMTVTRKNIIKCQFTPLQKPSHPHMTARSNLAAISFSFVWQ